MGQAKARGTYQDRKSNPLGKKPNHMKGIFDYQGSKLTRLMDSKMQTAAYEARRKLRGIKP